MQPTVLPQPTTPAMVSSFMQFCSETMKPSGREVLADQRGRPFGVVRLHADEGDVDRLFLGELLRVGHVQRAHLGGEFRHVADVADLQAVRSHVLDMLGPGIDEGDVLAGLRHVRAGIAADGARPHDRDLLLGQVASSRHCRAASVARWAPWSQRARLGSGKPVAAAIAKVSQADSL